MSTVNETTDLDATVEKLMKLPPEQRLEVGERLIASVPIFPDKEAEAELAKTVERRLREIEDGTVKTIPGDEAFRMVRKELERARENRQAD